MQNGKTNYSKVIKLLLILILIISVALVTFVLYPRDNTIEPFGSTSAFSTESVTESISEVTESTTETTEITSTEAVKLEKKNNEETGRFIIDPEQELWNLVVVNITREMPENYEPELLEVCDSGKYLHHLVAPYYEAMYEAAKKDGYILTPYSTYRSYSRQQYNYNNLTETYMSQYKLTREEAAKKAATVILPPGTSEHNLGLAIDICGTESSFKDTEEYAWLMDNAYKYGFILRYTAEKQDITGIIPEPWHWRFVGVEYAEDIMKSGLCLEEYLDSKGIEY